MNVWDAFSGSAFTLQTLTAAVNERPYKPGYLGGLNLVQSEGISTTSLSIERIKGVLKLVSTTPRGGPGIQHMPGKRTMKQLAVAHLQVDDFIGADEVQGVREFGSDNQLRTLQNTVNGRIGEISDNMDMTHENWLMGMIKGQVLDADGSVLWDLYDEFDVSPHTAVDFTLGTATTDIHALCNGIHRKVMGEMGASPYETIIAVCGDNYFDKLWFHQEVKGTNNSNVDMVRWSHLAGPYTSIRYGKILFVNYRGAENGPNVATNEARFFPVGAPGLYLERFGPADYNETVNTKGLPKYAKVRVAENGKGVHVEVQTNPIVLCTRPRVLIRGFSSN